MKSIINIKEKILFLQLCVNTKTHFLRVCVCLCTNRATQFYGHHHSFSQNVYTCTILESVVVVYTFYKYTKMCVMITIYLVNHGKWFSFLCYVHRLENYRVTHTQTHTQKRQENPKCVQTNPDFVVLVYRYLNDQ